MPVALLKKLILTLLVVISGSINISCLDAGDHVAVLAAAEQLPESEQSGNDENVGQSGDAGEDLVVRTPGVHDLLQRVTSAVAGSGTSLITRIFFLTPLRPPCV